MGPTLEITSDGPVIHEKKVKKRNVTESKKSEDKEVGKKEKTPIKEKLIEDKDE